MTDDEKARIAKNEYMREYERKHREKRAEQHKKYWVRKYNKTHGAEDLGNND